jgi:hypothetical protein
MRMVVGFVRKKGGGCLFLDRKKKKKIGERENYRVLFHLIFR